MKIAVWRSGHEIADTVAEDVFAGFDKADYQSSELFMCNRGTDYWNSLIGSYDLHIAYGILRGTADVFRECDRQGKPWICIDRGYWKPGHYNGYYRVSLRGTQQTSGWPEPDYARWDALGLEIEDYRERDGYTLVCPPTTYVANFFNDKNIYDMAEKCRDIPNKIVRFKGDEQPIDWHNVRKLITFNSSVGWQALRRGIPVESDPQHSMLGAWIKQKNLDTTQKLMDSRRELFATMSACQMTLEEMRSGLLFPLIQKLLAKSSGAS